MKDFTLYPYAEGEILLLRKAHPCGSKEWQVVRAGAEITVDCRGCGHRVRMKRRDLEKATREIRKVQE